MKNSEFINGLTSNLKPIKPISILRNTSVWLAISLILVAMLITMMPVRQLSHMIKSPMFIVSSLWLLVNTIFLAFAANAVGIPAYKNQRSVLIISFSVYLLLIAALLATAAHLRSPFETEGLDCIRGVIVLSILPMVFFYGLLRKLAPSSPWVVGLLAGLAGGSLGAFGLGFSCSIEDPLHILIFHFLSPALVLGSIGLIASKRILRW